MLVRSAVALLLLTCGWTAVPDRLAAQTDDTQQLGSVHFETSCNEVAQRRFDRAMRYQHSFWYSASGELFEQALQADASCAIAHWGRALSLLYNPHVPPAAANLPLGLEALNKGKALGAKTERERDYIAALLVFYRGYDRIDHRTRVIAYSDAMGALAAKYPQDVEAQIAYAITLNVAASPADKTYTKQLKGAAILEPVFAQLPRHPGVAHYLIHLYDYPAIAAKGLPAARRYAQIAPAAPHAQHMPSHIFTRVGAWPDSIRSNMASARSAKTHREIDDQMHALDYMVYAYLQQGDDASAKAAVEEMRALSGWSRPAAAYAANASPARYVIERGDWAAAASLPVAPTPVAYAEAVSRFARALGASRTGDLAAARADIAILAELSKRLADGKDAYWAEQVDIQRQVASAWLLAAEGQHDAALAGLAAAADAEDRTEKHPVTPGPLVPAREAYAQMLRDRGRLADALTAYQSTMTKEPNRFNSLAGAARTLDALGDRGTADGHYRSLAALAVAQSPRPEVSDARARGTR